MANPKKRTPALSTQEAEALLSILHQRFEKHISRHSTITWSDVEKKLKAQPDKLRSLQEMEDTGGEPDVVAFDKKKNEITFFDCATETPAKRRSLCYDNAAWDARKENKPAGNAIDMAADMGVEVLNEEEYRYLQSLGKFDLKTSSWLKTDDAMRKLDGALFGDHRFGRTFIYHNGVQSYYAARGWRGKLVV